MSGNISCVYGGPSYPTVVYGGNPTLPGDPQYPQQPYTPPLYPMVPPLIVQGITEARVREIVREELRSHLDEIRAHLGAVKDLLLNRRRGRK